MDNGETPSEPLSQPVYFGNYEILKSIGKGKFAIVYRAKKIDDEQVVALKRISVDSMDQKSREKCLKEVKLLQSLDHPNIIRYIDSFITDNDLFIVYEWAAAGDLKRQLRKAQERGVGFEERIVWKYFSQICDAMQHMHEKRIMHRDLKPANIFLTLDGTIKVGDLGLSRELSEHTIQAHSKVGTPLYMAPEVLKGDCGYDFKSDIWSLGCLLYELAMLKSPFKSEGLNLYSLFQKISNGEYQKLPDNYSEELRNLAYSMISTKPEERPEIGYVCDVARRMRASTAAQKNSKLRRSDEMEVPAEMQAKLADIDSAARAAEIATPVNEMRAAADDKTKAPRKPRSDEKAPRPAGEFEDKMTLDQYFQQQPPAAAPGGGSGNPSVSTPKIQSDSSRNTPDNSRVPVRELNREASASSTYVPDEFATKARAPQDAHKRTKHVAAEKGAAGIGKPIVPPLNGIAAAVRGTETSPVDGDTEASGGGLDAAICFAVMEQLYDKLLVLRYPMHDPHLQLKDQSIETCARGRLLPIHFACSLQKTNMVAGHDRGYQFQQFQRMVHVAVWLCDAIGGAAADIMRSLRLDEDSSITIARQMLRAMQATGTPMPPELAEVTPTSLTSGYGLPVCSLLSHFADCALKATNYTPQPCVYVDEANVEVEGAGTDEEDNDIDESQNALETSRASAEGEEKIAGQSSDNGQHLAGSMLQGAIDPMLWKEETERVARQLALASASASRTSLGFAWYQHIDAIKRFTTLSLPGRSASATELGIASAVSALTALRDSIVAAKEKLALSEKHINNSTQFGALKEQYTALEKELEGIRGRTAILSAQIEKLTAELSIMEEQLEEQGAQLSSKMEEQGSSANNQSVRMKSALQQLKGEVAAMHMSILLLGNNLLHTREHLARQVQQKLNKKKRNRRRNKMTGGKMGDVLNDSDLSDDSF